MNTKQNGKDTKGPDASAALWPRIVGAAVSRSAYDSPELWKLNCPVALIAAVGALRDHFAEAHWKVGSVTEKMAYSLLHAEGPKALEDILPDFMQLKQIAGVVVSKHFNQTLSSGTPPAIFRAFLDLYQTTLTGQMLVIFDQLVEIGFANKDVLGDSYYLDWAREQSVNLIRSEAHLIPQWVRRCCDIQERDTTEDRIRWLEWRNWQAPKLLEMKPSHQYPYEAKAVWDRLNVDDSRSLLRHFETYYHLHLERLLKRAWEEATILKAKQPPALQKLLKSDGDGPGSYASQDDKKRGQGSLRQLLTKKKHDAWKREYQRLRKLSRGMSDVWYSQKIAKLTVAEGASSETIRKNMK